MVDAAKSPPPLLLDLFDFGAILDAFAVSADCELFMRSVVDTTQYRLSVLNEDRNSENPTPHARQTTEKVNIPLHTDSYNQWRSNPLNEPIANQWPTFIDKIHEYICPRMSKFVFMLDYDTTITSIHVLNAKYFRTQIRQAFIGYNIIFLNCFIVADEYANDDEIQPNEPNTNSS